MLQNFLVTSRAEPRYCEVHWAQQAGRAVTAAPQAALLVCGSCPGGMVWLCATDGLEQHRDVLCLTAFLLHPLGQYSTQGCDQGIGGEKNFSQVRIILQPV